MSANRWMVACVSASMAGCCFGSGSGGAAEAPVAAAVLLTQIAVASDHACAVTVSGTVECWGLNSRGQLGNGTTVSSPGASVVVAGIHDAVEVDVMFQTSCARRHDGTVWCWGRGDSLGTGVAADASTPVQVPGITNAVDISLELGSYVVTADGDVAGWGTNLLGLLGLPSWIEDVPTPLGILHRDGMAEAFANGFGGCGRTSSGEALCWGGAAGSISLPTSGVDAMSANLHTCVRANGVWMCAGPNEHGELGVTSARATSPVPFPRPNVRTLVTAFGATWIVGNDGTLDCLGSECDVGVPRPAVALVQDVSADGEYVCARLLVGATCWGRLSESSADAPVYAWSGAQPIVLSGAEPAAAGPVIPARVVAREQLQGAYPGHESPVDWHAAAAPGPADPIVVGQVVAAQWHGQAFYQARITDLLADGSVRVHFESGEHETLARSRLRLGAFDPVAEGTARCDGAPLGETPAAPGTRVLVHDSYWFQARIVSDDGGPTVRIHWLGHLDADDENVRRANVRLAG